MPSITALYAGLYALLLLALAVPISLRRMKLGIGINDGGNTELSRAIRVHANAVEWGLPILLLLLVAELNRANAVVVARVRNRVRGGAACSCDGTVGQEWSVARTLRRHAGELDSAAGACPVERLGPRPRFCWCGAGC